ncbi:hypothetical protein V8G54_014480 [Vigna mungo]|uniref:Uncharacterized protein n=1 Tax=Vigna mungo TaxID=3915 RepID=A0AAQ3NHQ4_VIGMU
MDKCGKSSFSVLENSQIVPSDFAQFNNGVSVVSLQSSSASQHTSFPCWRIKNGRTASALSACVAFMSDLMIMYGILQSIPLNLPHLLQSIMYKAKRLDAAPLPYPLLVSHICEYKGVNVFNEHYETVLPGHKIGDNSLRQMGIIKHLCSL